MGRRGFSTKKVSFFWGRSFGPVALLVGTLVFGASSVPDVQAGPNGRKSQTPPPTSQPIFSNQTSALTPSPAVSSFPILEVAPTISSLVKDSVLGRALRDREVMTHADLQGFKKGMEKFSDIKPVLLPEPRKKGFFTGSGAQAGSPPSLEGYDFYVLVLVKAPLERTRQVLTHYQVYSELVPYVSRTEYFPASKILHVEGGIWKYRINSRIRFEERAPGWIRYRIVSGHFRGMVGEILLEPVGENGREGTLVLMHGQSIANRFPPAFVIEQGAQVVFGFTANRIRSYIESGQLAPAVTDASALPPECLKIAEARGDADDQQTELPAQCAARLKEPSPVPQNSRSGGTNYENPELPKPRKRL